MAIKYDICILDDKLPIKNIAGTDDTKIIGTNLLWHLLSDESQWEDTDLLNFIKLLNERGNYNPCGFTNHDLFLNHIQETIYSPDIIIFDWDVGTKTDQADSLLEILESTYSLVAIFTTQDKKSEVTNEINKPKYSSYIDSRLFIIKKEQKDSVGNLADKIKEKENIFSFKYSKELKQKTLRALDKTLSNIGSLSFNQFVSIFGKIEGSKRKLTAIDFTDIITDKLKSELINIGFEEKGLEAENQKIEDGNVLRKIWHYRLYHKPQDDIVRKGDIIEQNETKIKFLIISSDCHLNQFWQKNFGYLTLVPVYKLEDDSIKTKILAYTTSEARRSYKNSSISNTRAVENITFLPGLLEEESKYEDYLVSPKEILSIYISKPEEENSKSQLKYTQIKDFTGDKRLRLSEPFLTPLVDYVLKIITGLGAPDYTDSLRESLTKKIKDLKK